MNKENSDVVKNSVSFTLDSSKETKPKAESIGFGTKPILDSISFGAKPVIDSSPSGAKPIDKTGENFRDNLRS